MVRRGLAAGGLALVGLTVVAAAGGGCRGSAGEPALVFAAASLADVLTEAARELGAGRADMRFDFNFAGSNVLAQQILSGAPADLFLSADRRQVERLVAAGAVRADEVTPLAANRLVVVVPSGSRAGELSSPRELLRFRRLALADPEAVPAGLYARAWLEREGLWDELAPRVVPALDVRAALAAVAAGSLEAGVVYASDARTADRVEVVYRVPPERAGPIEYVAAPIAGRGGGPAGELLAFLGGPAGRALLRRHGFEPPGGGGSALGHEAPGDAAHDGPGVSGGG